MLPMQETLLQIVEAEKKASEIIEKASRKAAEKLQKTDNDINTKISKYRNEESERYNQEILKAEQLKKDRIESLKNDLEFESVDIEKASDEVLKRIMKTIFD